jgi:hypothetical protein
MDTFFENDSLMIIDDDDEINLNEQKLENVLVVYKEKT